MKLVNNQIKVKLVILIIFLVKFNYCFQLKRESRKKINDLKNISSENLNKEVKDNKNMNLTVNNQYYIVNSIVEQYFSGDKVSSDYHNNNNHTILDNLENKKELNNLILKHQEKDFLFENNVVKNKQSTITEKQKLDLKTIDLSSKNHKDSKISLSSEKNNNENINKIEDKEKYNNSSSNKQISNSELKFQKRIIPVSVNIVDSSIKNIKILPIKRISEEASTKKIALTQSKICDKNCCKENAATLFNKAINKGIYPVNSNINNDKGIPNNSSSVKKSDDSNISSKNNNNTSDQTKPIDDDNKSDKNDDDNNNNNNNKITPTPNFVCKDLSYNHRVNLLISQQQCEGINGVFKQIYSRYTINKVSYSTGACGRSSCYYSILTKFNDSNTEILLYIIDDINIIKLTKYTIEPQVSGFRDFDLVKMTIDELLNFLTAYLFNGLNMSIEAVPENYSYRFYFTIRSQFFDGASGVPNSSRVESKLNNTTNNNNNNNLSKLRGRMKANLNEQFVSNFKEALLSLQKIDNRFNIEWNDIRYISPAEENLIETKLSSNSDSRRITESLVTKYKNRNTVDKSSEFGLILYIKSLKESNFWIKNNLNHGNVSSRLSTNNNTNIENKNSDKSKKLDNSNKLNIKTNSKSSEYKQVKTIPRISYLVNQENDINYKKNLEYAFPEYELDKINPRNENDPNNYLHIINPTFFKYDQRKFDSLSNKSKLIYNEDPYKNYDYNYNYSNLPSNTNYLAKVSSSNNYNYNNNNNNNNNYEYSNRESQRFNSIIPHSLNSINTNKLNESEFYNYNFIEKKSTSLNNSNNLKNKNKNSNKSIHSIISTEALENKFKINETINKNETLFADVKHYLEKKLLK